MKNFARLNVYHPDVCLPIYTIETLYVIKPTQLSAYAIIYNLKFKKIMPDEYSLLI